MNRLTLVGSLVLSLLVLAGGRARGAEPGADPKKPAKPEAESKSVDPSPAEQPKPAKPDPAKPDPAKPDQPELKVQGGTIKVDGKEIKVGGQGGKVVEIKPGEGGKIQVKPGQGELLKPDHPGHDTKPAPKSEVKRPAVEAKVSKEAKALLDKVTAAYKKVSKLEVTGTLTRTTQAGEQTTTDKASFSGSFLAPNQFRHEMEADVVVGSTGKQVYAFRPARNDYKVAEAPRERGPSEKLPQPMRTLLDVQNPGLTCAIVDDAGAYLVEGCKEVTREADAKLDGKSFPVLAFTQETMSYRVLVDPATFLLRQVVVDNRKNLEASGVPDVKKDTITYDYTKVAAGEAASAKAEQFAWAAPDGAKDAGAEEGEEREAMALAGKPAPDFTLKNLAGKDISLKDHQGAVVVLDFWATWCGPCRASLPGLNKVYNDLKGKGLVVYAVDLEEPKDKVQATATELKLDIPVLLDEKSEVSKQYGVSAIPHTVIIGKDGKVAKVIIGGGQEAKIRAAVEAAMGK